MSYNPENQNNLENPVITYHTSIFLKTSRRTFVM